MIRSGFSVFFDQQKVVVLQFEVALIIHIIIDVSCLCCVNGSEQAHVEALFQQFRARDFSLAGAVEL